MRIQLDFHNGGPIYAQIVAQVQGQLAAGQLKPGEQLPTVRQLAGELRVHFNTVARAYRLLHEARLISAQQGRGTYILEQPATSGQKKLRRAKLQALTRRYVGEAQQLGYTPEEVKKQIESLLKRWPEI